MAYKFDDGTDNYTRWASAARPTKKPMLIVISYGFRDHVRRRRRELNCRDAPKGNALPSLGNADVSRGKAAPRREKLVPFSCHSSEQVVELRGRAAVPKMLSANRDSHQHDGRANHCSAR